jgi:hypothetical protein
MGPTRRDWLSAGILTLALVILIVILVAAAIGADGGAATTLRALLAA